MKKVSRPGVAIAVVLSALLMGCGPGGGSSSPPAANQAALSADQKAFEQFTLAPNASYDIEWSLPASGTPVSGTNFLSSVSLQFVDYSLTEMPTSADALNAEILFSGMIVTLFLSLPF